MRVLVISHYYASHLSGIPIVAENLNRCFVESGHEVVWAASHRPMPSHDNSSPSGRLVFMQSWNVTEDVFRFPYPLWGPNSLLRLRREVAGADLIHLHDSLYMGNVWASLIAGSGRKPVVVTQHVGLIPYRSAILRTTMSLANRTLGRLTLSRASQVVFCSLAVQEYFSKWVRFRRTPAFIGNGVDRELFHPVVSAAERETIRRELAVPGDRPLVLFVGRFVEKKGIHWMAELCRLFPDVHFMFVGWGPLDPASWRLHNVSVFHLQPHNTMRRFYCAADLLLLPSVGEGFPLVVQEAMSCGLPCMFSRETGKAVDRGHELFRLTDLDLPALISSLRASLHDRQGLELLRRNVAAFANKEWNWQRSAERYLAIFRGLL